MPTHALHIRLVLPMSVMALMTASGCHGTAGDTPVNKTGQQIETDIDKIITPAMPQAELVNPPQGQSEPLMSGSVADKTGNRSAYVDPTYGFRIEYPRDFVIRSREGSKLTQFTPAPVASIFFLNPTMAARDLAGIEPPDLQVQVYQAVGVASLKSWLVSVGFMSKDSEVTDQPYRNAHLSGLKVCQSTMIAPGCSVYFLHEDRVYQLTAISLEGETMIQTFALSRS